MRNLTKIFIPVLLFTFVYIGLFGVILIPIPAKASLLSLLLGDQVSADTNSNPTNDNSQNMPLLQANVYSAPVYKDKKSNNKDKNKSSNEVALNENDSINISSNALVPAGNLTADSSATTDLDSSDDQVSVYVIRKGDSISKIADMFNVSVNTILSANDMKKGDKLVEGTVLVILPISGIEHTVVKGQTLKSIAKLYKVDIGDIASYNGISENDGLAIGDKLMIPGADSMSDEGGDKPASNLGSAVVRDTNYYITHPIQSIIGYFVNPVPTGRKTQGLHGPGHRGIDIGAPTGTPMYASADGTVQIVKTGCVVKKRLCGGGYGNMVVIEHFNGTRTLYAHMSKVATFIGSSVKQGEVIGYVGNTGKSTGPHVHFEVFNARNPGADWSWKF